MLVLGARASIADTASLFVCVISIVCVCVCVLDAGHGSLCVEHYLPVLRLCTCAVLRSGSFLTVGV